MIYVAWLFLLGLLLPVLGMTIDEALQVLTAADLSSHNKKQYLESIQRLEGTATADGEIDPRVASALGRAFFFGRRHTMKPDYRRAFQYFARSTDPDSLYMTSLCYSQGLGVSRSTEMALVYLKFAARDGSEAAQLALGYRYAAGIGVARNCPLARDYFYASAKRTAAAYNSQRHLVVPKPLLLTEKKDFRSSQQEIVEYYEYSADKEQTSTLLLLGQIFYEGYNGTPIDYKQARWYFEQAAELGSGSAKGFLGEMYLWGLGVEKDTQKAFRLFREGAKGGSAVAQNGLGVLYRDGLEVLADPEEALQHFLKAAEEGLAEAQYNAATLMHKMTPGSHEDKSLALLVQAFQQGHVLSQFEIAKRNIHNNLVCTFCLTLLRGVAERGPGMALFDDAFADYHEGDAEVALAKYFYLADRGHEAAQSNAAQILMEAGSPAGDRRALVFLHRAANQGDLTARVHLGDLFYAGRGIPAPDLITAYLAYKEAYGRNSAQASFNLGYMYERGLGVPRDYFLARRYYDAAAVMDSKNNPGAWVPVKIALASLAWKEAMENIQGFTWYAPYLVTGLVLAVGLFALMRRILPRYPAQLIN